MDDSKMDVYVVEWSSLDSEDHFEIQAFGKTRDGCSAVLRIHFYPYFFVKTPGWSLPRQKLYIAECSREYNANDLSAPVARKDAWGFSTEPEAFVQLAFNTLREQRIARSRISKSKQTFEGNVDPVVRLCHVRGISPTGWIRFENFKECKERVFPHADIELSGPFSSVFPSEVVSRPPLVLCSWDIEVYSHDGSFPVPEIQENAVIQIASAFQKLGDPEPYRRVVVCLHETSSIETGEIVSVGSEADVYAEWIRLLQEESVDILMGWNTW